MTEPNLDDWKPIFVNGVIPKEFKDYIANQVREARLDEIHAWFDMPKHYPGEEYLDEPFAKAKCKTPKKITYYTLDSSFTYSLKERLATLNGVKK